MKLRKLILHNFRSIKDAEFSLSDYSLLVGENNSGKTAVLTALRIFYEDGGLKYDRSTDFPKFQTPDQESWIELHFETMPEEHTSLKRDYQSNDGVLRVRRYFQSENKEMVRTGQSNIYGYENGILSKSLFYGAKNISQAKLGNVVHIPEVSRADDTLKVSGPSPFRDMLGFVMKRAVQDSQPFSGLQQAFEKFNSEFREEASRDGFSVRELEKDINDSLSTWQIKFGVEINAVRPEDIVKNLVGHYIEDLNLDSMRIAGAPFEVFLAHESAAVEALVSKVVGNGAHCLPTRRHSVPRFQDLGTLPTVWASCSVGQFTEILKDRISGGREGFLGDFPFFFAPFSVVKRTTSPER